MKRPDTINYQSSEWRAIVKALGELQQQLDLANRDMNLDFQSTQNNRALQQAYQTIINWDNQPGPTVVSPAYAVPMGGGYGTDDPHPDDEPVY